MFFNYCKEWYSILLTILITGGRGDDNAAGNNSSLAIICAYKSEVIDGTPKCICPEEYVLQEDERSCAKIDICFRSVSSCQQKCLPLSAFTYACRCLTGYILGDDGKSCVKITSCKANSGFCEQKCQSTEEDHVYECKCQEGYRLELDGKSCTKIHTCSQNNGYCSHICEENKGIGAHGYVCKCKTEYLISSDGRKCIAPNEGIEMQRQGNVCLGKEVEGNCIKSGSVDRIIQQSLNDPKNNDPCIKAGLLCQHICMNDKIIPTPVCSCFPGYILDPDGITCLRIKGCSENSDCQESCVAIAESKYSCTCKDGNFLLPDGQGCLKLRGCRSSPCQHQCVSLREGLAVCKCNNGYVLKHDKKSCQKISICTINPKVCAHDCEATGPTTFICKCDRGYELDKDGRSSVLLQAAKFILDPDILIQFRECSILRNHKIFKEDLWIRNGKIIDPEPVFFDERRVADIEYFCDNKLISPGFIDVQINGAYGINFSDIGEQEDPLTQIKYVGQRLLQDGVTSFVPTIITSPSEYYNRVLPKIKKSHGEMDCANILGVHLEGPFINPEKKGIHEPRHIRFYDELGYQALKNVYGPGFDGGDESAAILITLAPEYRYSSEIINTLVGNGIRVSIGHSMANLDQGMEAVKSGASFITHLFNAMLPFHHRDPGLVGLLACTSVMPTIYFGLITDGVHTNPAAVRIAQRTHPKGLVIVTDAILTMGVSSPAVPGIKSLPLIRANPAFDPGPPNPVPVQEHFTFGGHDVILSSGGKAAMSREHTIAGGMTTFDACVQFFHRFTGCDIVEALESGSLHPAQMLGIDTHKGTLNFGADADLVLLDPETLKVEATFLAGQLAWQNLEDGNRPIRVKRS